MRKTVRSSTRTWFLKVDIPIEAYPSKGVYVCRMNLDRPSVVAQLLKEIKSKRYSYMHFGIPCTTWRALNRTKGGTRRKHCPDGPPERLPRETLGNRQAASIARLCEQLV